jgi:hypothetical protein
MSIDTPIATSIIISRLYDAYYTLYIEVLHMLIPHELTEWL